MRIGKYRLRDNYTRFYLKYVQPNKTEVRRKIRLLPVKSGKSKRPVLVYAGEIAKSVEADGYFDAIVPASRLLGL